MVVNDTGNASKNNLNEKKSFAALHFSHLACFFLFLKYKIKINGLLSRNDVLNVLLKTAKLKMNLNRTLLITSIFENIKIDLKNKITLFSAGATILQMKIFRSNPIIFKTFPIMFK